MQPRQIGEVFLRAAADGPLRLTFNPWRPPDGGEDETLRDLRTDD
jgi:hypothetical protein